MVITSLQLATFLLSMLGAYIYAPYSAAAECLSDTTYQLNVSEQKIVAGKPFTLTWKRVAANSDIRQTETLVLQTSEKAHFGPGHYLALREPATGSGKGDWVSRVLIPVPKVKKPSGSVEIISLQAGTLDIRWSVESDSNCSPSGKNANANANVTVTVLPGAPKLYVDPLDRRKPKSTESAKGSFYTLEIYDGYYKVINSITGALVLSNMGIEPVFSPSGRFLSSILPGADELQLFDLAAPREIFRGEASIMAFSHNDSFALIAGINSGAWLVRTLQDSSDSLSGTAKVSEENTGSEASILMQPWEPLELLPAKSFAGSDGFFLGEHEISLSLTSHTIAYRESLISGPNGDTQYDVTEPLVFDLLTRERISSKNPQFSTAIKRLVPSDRDNEIKSWLSDGGLAVTWVADGRHLPLTRTSTVTSQKNLARMQVLKGQLRTITVEGQPLIRDIDSALSELDSTFQFYDSRELLPVITSGNRKLARKIEDKLQNFYDKKKVRFETTHDIVYSATQLPDPHNPLIEGGITTVDLSNQGQLFYEWSSGDMQYWLQQSAAGGRRGGTTNLALLGVNGTDIRFERLYDRADNENKTFEQPFILGDSRFALNKINLPPVISLIDEQYLAVSPKPSDSILIFDLKNWSIHCSIGAIEGSNLVRKMNLLKNRQIFFLERTDNTFSFYNCLTGKKILDGQFVNGDVVVISPDGFYDGPVEAAELLKVKSDGLSGILYLSQFEGKFKIQGLLSKIVNGKKIEPITLPAPPVLMITNPPSGIKDLVNLRAISSTPLTQLRLIGDGRILQTITLHGLDENLAIDLKKFLSQREITAIAFDQNGFTSSPLKIKNPLAESTHKGRLIAYALGVDTYKDTRLPKLSYAASDAQRVLAALQQVQGYSSLEIAQSFDQSISKKEVMGKIQEAVNNAGVDDTLFFSFSGHGIASADGSLALAVMDTNIDAIDKTALLWSDVMAALKLSKARIVILLDVCHAGLADPRFVVSNDLIADRLTNQSGASILIFSATKGRQLSRESNEVKGGIFSVAFTYVISTDRKRFDLNADGHIQIGELYRGLKLQVASMEENRQTPWLSRNELFGDFSIF